MIRTVLTLVAAVACGGLAATHDEKGPVKRTVVSEKDIAAKNPNQARPLFLLAYIDYNTGNERLAAGRLDLAEKRAGAGDTFYSLVKKHWLLPDKSETPAPENNKP